MMMMEAVVDPDICHEAAKGDHCWHVSDENCGLRICCKCAGVDDWDVDDE